MQASESHFHLGLDADCTDDLEADRLHADVLKHCRLAAASFAMQDQ
jgi:hypothetical protein